MAKTDKQRVTTQLPEVLNFIADTMEQNPNLHFNAALEIGHNHFHNEAGEILVKVVCAMQLGDDPFEALQRIASTKNIPAFTEVAEYIIETHQPDHSFITSATLRRAAQRLTTD